jgi:hypothetical protein
VIAFFYVNRFSELAELPQFKRIEVLEQAHRRVYESKMRLFLNFIVCLALAFAVGFSPRMFFQMPNLAEGFLLFIGMFVAIQLYGKLYGQILHEKVREVLNAECS